MPNDNSRMKSEEVNSNLDAKHGTVSFSELPAEAANKGDRGYGGNLDKLHSNMSNYPNQSSQTFWTGNGGNAYAITLHKYTNDAYCGIIQCYDWEITHYFSYFNGSYSFK